MAKVSISTKKIIASMKEGIKKVHVKPKVQFLKPGEVRVRDMRQESMDGGSYGANEYFGESDK